MALLGWISSLCLALCAYPQARRCYYQGHARGIDHWFLFLWTMGEITGLIYVSYLGSWPLIVNYSLNLTFLLVIFKFMFFPRVESSKPKGKV